MHQLSALTQNADQIVTFPLSHSLSCMQKQDMPVAQRRIDEAPQYTLTNILDIS
jgi:hypothetical protein